MATSLLALIDDIASMLDDVSVMAKVAAKKTTGVLGDDLALNAEQLTGVNADRELPIIWGVFKGSLRNKAILVPLALLISYFAPWLVVPLLMIGGAYLCFEGSEKIYENIFPHPPELRAKTTDKEKIKGAVRTDFILSAEIITISLGVVAKADIISQIVVMSVIALLMTIGVYSFVALIIRLDDIGLYFMKKGRFGLKTIGLGLIRAVPYLMKLLGVAGTIAMFLVGGGIITHGLNKFHHQIEEFATYFPASYHGLILSVTDGVVGLFLGFILVGLINLFNKFHGKNHEQY